MGVLIVDAELATGRKWGVMADGGMSLEAIRGFVLVPTDQIEGMTRDEIGDNVLSLVVTAKAARLKCAMEYCFFPEQFRTHLHEIEHILREAEALQSDVLEEEVNNQRMIPDSLAWSASRPDFGLSALKKLHSEITGRLRKEHTTLLLMRQNHRKKKLSPGRQTRLKEIVGLLRGCELCMMLDGNHSEACEALAGLAKS